MSLHEFKFHLQPKEFPFALQSSEEKNIACVLIWKIIAKFAENLLSAFNLQNSGISRFHKKLECKNFGLQA
jgi:hypothetical protein